MKTFTYFFHKPKHLFKIAVLISCVLLLSNKANATIATGTGATCGAVVGTTTGQFGTSLGCTAAINISGTTTMGTAPQQNCAGTAPKNVGWFSFTTAATAQTYFIAATTTTATADLQIKIWSGTCGTLAQIGACINNVGIGLQTEQVSLQSVASPSGSQLGLSTTYYIEIINNGSAVGMSTGLCIETDATQGVTCSNPTSLSATCNTGPALQQLLSNYVTTQGSPAIDPTTTCGAAPVGSFAREHWYSYTITGSYNQFISVSAAITGLSNPVVQIFSGSCGSLTPITGACANSTNSLSAQTETATTASAQSPGTYYIRVLDYMSSWSTPSVSRVCVNTTCAAANALSSGCQGPFTISEVANPANTVGSSTSSCVNANAELWYTYTTASSAYYTVTGVTDVLSGGNFSIQVSTGSCASSTLTQSSCTDNNSATGAQNEAVSFGGAAGTYYIRLIESAAGDIVDNLCINPTPANDACSGAISITTPTPGVSCSSVSGTLLGATSSSYSSASCSGSNATNEDVWYSFTTSSNAAQVYNISLSGMDNPAFQVYSSSCGGTVLSCQDAYSGTTTESVILSGLSTTTTYWIQVYDGNTGIPATPTFSLCLSSPPINDECANAVSLSPANTCVATTGTVNLATLSGVTVTCSGTVSDDDVWYYFQATGASHTVTVTGSGIAPVLEVFNAVAPGTSATCLGSSIICNASATLGATISSSFYTTVGQYYFVRVYNYGGAATATTGAFTICLINPPPPNDECAGAISITPHTYCTTTSGYVDAATQSLPATCAGTTANEDVWYSFVATATSHIVTVTGSASFDPVFEVYSIACGATSLGCTNANSTLGGTETATLTGLTVGATYWVRVYEAGSGVPATTTFTICVSTPPINDNCSGAITLTSNTTATYTTDSIAGATQSQAATSGCGTANDDVWFSFTASQTTHVVNVVGSSSFTAVFELFSGSCGSLTSLGCYSAASAGGLVSQSFSGLTPGNTYLVRVYDFGAGIPATNTFFIAITHTFNDQCTSAITVLCGNSYNGTTVSATTTNDPTTSCPGNISSRAGVWYQFVGTGVSTTVTTCTSQNPTKINIYTGACGGAYSCVASAVATTCGNGQSVTFTSVSGTTYWIFVYNSSGTAPGTSGTFTLAVSCGSVVNNDPCSGAIAVTCGSATNGSTLTATTTGDPTGTCGTSITAPGVWYVFAGTGATVTADLCTNLTYDTKLNVFSGTCSSYTCVTGNDDACALGSRVTFATVVGTNYYIFVSGYANHKGTFTLTISCATPPVNDLCANATPVVCGGSYSGSTVLASSTGDYTSLPSCVTSQFTYSPGVWYVYHSTTATSITASVCTSNYDNMINVYSGTCGGTYTCVAGSDDYCGFAAGGQVTFTTAACTDYYIFVNGYAGSVGTFTLNVTGSGCTSAPTNDLCTSATVIPSCGTTGLTGTTVGATTTGDPTATCGVAITGPGVWYVYNATDSLYLQASLCNTTASACYPLYNNVVNVYSGSCASLNCIGGNSGFCSSSSQVNFLTNTGSNNYYIFVQGASNTVGPFTLDFNGVAITTGQVIGSTTSTGNFGACVPLPIELLSFTGQSQGSRNLLKWETASETNNDYFTVEKSQDAISFSPLDRVNGAGNSSHAINYSIYDNKPFNDLTYYRLKQTDYNGVYTYSTIIAVTNSLNETSINNIRPNPTSDNINFDLFMTIKGKITVQIIDFSGQIVHEETQDVTDGSSVMTVKMNDLSPGVYSLKVTSDHTGFVTVTKVVKN